MTEEESPEKDPSTHEDPWPTEPEPVEFPFVPVMYIPETEEQKVRQTGLAGTVGIVFFCCVFFMLFLGWIADQLLGSSPWGLVGGIVLGSVIGFIQVFRITSQIFNSKKAESEMRPLMSRDEDEE